MEEAMAMLTKSGKTPEELYKALCEQRVDLVFTAHPTQAMRVSVRKKYVNLFRDLRNLLHKVPNVEHHEIMEDMYANVQVTPAARTPVPTLIICAASQNLPSGLWRLGDASTYPCCSGVARSSQVPVSPLRSASTHRSRLFCACQLPPSHSHATVFVVSSRSVHAHSMQVRQA